MAERVRKEKLLTNHCPFVLFEPVATIRTTNPKHIPLGDPAARHLGVARRTLSRAIRGLFPNPELVAGYRAYVLDYIASLDAGSHADATVPK